MKIININNKDLIQKKRYYYMDLLRIIASFGVITIHTSDKYFHLFNMNYSEYFVIFIFNGLFRWAVPIFFMISGSLFLKKVKGFKSIFSSNIKNIFIHLIGWSTIYSLTSYYFQRITFSKVLIKILIGHFHLWFLYAIIGIYAKVPILNIICNKSGFFNFFIFISFIILFIIPNYIKLINYTYMNWLYKPLDRFFGSFKLYYPVETFYFLLGHYLTRKSKGKISLYIIYFQGFLAIIFIFMISNKFSFLIKHRKNYFSFRDFNFSFYSISIFIFFKENFTNNKILNYFKHAIKTISNSTFGIYLMHVLIYENITFKLSILKFLLTNPYYIGLNSFITFIICLILNLLLKKIPYFGTYLL